MDNRPEKRIQRKKTPPSNGLSSGPIMVACRKQKEQFDRLEQRKENGTYSGTCHRLLGHHCNWLAD